MDNVSTKFFLLGILAMFYMSCKTDRVDFLNNFYSKLEKNINEDLLMRFKNAPIDSAELYFHLFFEDYKAVVEEELVDNKEAKEYVERMKLDEKGLGGGAFFIYDFHSWLNNENHSLDYYVEIKKKTEQDKNNGLFDSNAMYEKEILYLILKNKEKCAIGDTLSLIFPIGTRDNKDRALLNEQPYLDFQKYPGADTLKLDGILMDKLLDSTDLIFKLRITD